MFPILFILLSFGVSVLLMAFFAGIARKKMSNDVNDFKNLLKSPEKPSFEITDEMFIRLAQRLGGRLCAEDITRQTSLNMDKAKETLDNLSKKGICEIKLDEVQQSGKIYYYFG